MGIANHPEWIAAGLHDLDLLAQQLAQHDDAAIGGTEMFLATVDDRALCLPGENILGRHDFHPVVSRFVFEAEHFERRVFIGRHRPGRR